jgi:hypothetical protein
VSGDIKFTRLEVVGNSPAAGRYGYLPGFWGSLTLIGINGNETSANMLEIAGAGELAGRTLLLMCTGAGVAAGTTSHYGAQIAIDITAWP